MSPSVYGVGFIGKGKFKANDGNGKPTKCYNTWKDMLRRCYDSKYHKKKSTYKNCTVCSEWHNFQNFAQWYYSNYYEFEDEKMALDKDILKKGNKIYSSNTCVFVPSSINNLFIKRDKCRGKYPIGVSKVKDKFEAWLSKGNKRIRLGYFNTPNEAFLAYKIAKEQYIKEVAEKWKAQISQKLYDTMMNYEVEIDD